MSSNNQPKPELTTAIRQQFLAMGYTNAHIEDAYKNTNGNPNVVGEYLLTHCEYPPSL